MNPIPPQAPPSPTVSRDTILDAAKRYVSSDRNTQYGEPEDNFASIAKFWETYLKNRRSEYALDGYDVALMMELFKIARGAVRPDSPDSCIDAAGYAACAGELLDKYHKKRGPRDVSQMEKPAAPPNVSVRSGQERPAPR